MFRRISQDFINSKLKTPRWNARNHHKLSNVFLSVQLFGQWTTNLLVVHIDRSEHKNSDFTILENDGLSHVFKEKFEMATFSVPVYNSLNFFGYYSRQRWARVLKLGFSNSAVNFPHDIDSAFRQIKIEVWLL